MLLFKWLLNLTDQGIKCWVCSEHQQEAVQVGDNVVGVVTVDEALPTVVYEPAVDG